MIDSHAHVAFRQFDEDREAVIERARAAGVRWVEVGTDLGQSRAALELAKQYPVDVIGATVGIHPSDVAESADWLAIHELLKHELVVAVGEVGLDYYRGGTYDEQLPVLEQFVQLATQHQLPMIFHVRSGENADAHADLLSYLQSLPVRQRPRGVIHTFSGTAKQAEQYVGLGMHLSFSGVVTFKNAGEILAVAQTMPLERMLIETDCPFLAPEPHRGARNEPGYVGLVAEQIATGRGVSAQTIAEATEANAWRFFAGQGYTN
ncbi:MAG TPA: TatD family hydrolase [Candidatus Andersenbacteria bacterium]|nr:TatD family hydrolase [Candidatus Andersenbacteria bacterium]